MPCGNLDTHPQAVCGGDSVSTYQLADGAGECTAESYQRYQGLAEPLLQLPPRASPRLAPPRRDAGDGLPRRPLAALGRIN